jgi:ferrous iron transport protein A
MEKNLGELNKGETGVILGLKASALAKRLLEVGFLEGARVEVMHESPYGGDPIAVRVRGSLVGIRREEANLIRVSVQGEK